MRAATGSNMPHTSSPKPAYIFVLVLGLIGLGIGALVFGSLYFQSESKAVASKKAAAAPEVKTRPLPHISPKESYAYDLNAIAKRAKFNAFPKIKFVKEIPENFVRPRKNRQIKLEASEPGALIAIYDYFPAQPLDICLSPCRLSVDVSEKYQIVTYKYGHLRYFGWVDTGIWPADKVFKTDLGPNWLETFETMKSCFEENEARRSEDRDAEPCIRHPPIPPQPAPRSAHCRMKFTITKAGYTKDVEAISCTDDFFKAAAVENVRTWYYYPKVENNEFVERLNKRSKIRFEILDENGNLIPE